MTDLTQLTPEQIKILADIIEMAKGVNPLWAKIIGGAISLFAAVMAILTQINNYRTKKNTEANKTTTELLAAYDAKWDEREKKLTALKNDAVTEFSGTINFAKNQMMTEIDKFKIVIANVNRDYQSKLGMIPKVQDRLSAVEKQQLEEQTKNSFRDEQLGKIVNGLKKVVTEKEALDTILKRGKKE